MLYPHNGYTDMIKCYENGLYGVVDHYTGLSLVSVESQIGFYLGGESMPYWNSQ